MKEQFEVVVISFGSLKNYSSHIGKTTRTKSSDPEAQRPKDPWTQKPSDPLGPESQRPRSPTTHLPKAPETQRPKDSETQQPTYPEAKRSNNPLRPRDLPRAPGNLWPRNPRDPVFQQF